MAEYLLVDGYNIIFSWPDLNEFAENGNLDAARMKLMEMLSNYQGYYKNTVILVFDGYKVKNNPGTVEKYHNIYVVYTKEAETADQYIEKVNGSLARANQVRVATSDRMEQVIILGQGATRVSARELQKEMEEMKREIRKDYLHKPQLKRNSLIDNLDPEMAALMEEMRLTEDPKEPPAGVKRQMEQEQKKTQKQQWKQQQKQNGQRKQKDGQKGKPQKNSQEEQNQKKQGKKK